MADLEPFHTEESESSACLGRCKRALERVRRSLRLGTRVSRYMKSAVGDCDRGRFEMP